ncbi:LOW QUALITY PROTEIN: mas-related G-protein coupled receptor member H-like [Liasis olivaceus]
MNFSLASMNATADYSEYNITNDFDDYQSTFFYSRRITFSVILIICCIGVPENGIIIWLLGFQIKRNSFTVLILNLAIADFGFLISMAIICIHVFTYCILAGIPWFFLMLLLWIMYMNGLFLLTAISIDRCVSVLFPIWHRCSRPKHLSPALCALLWIFSFLLSGINNIMEFVFEYNGTLSFHLLAAVLSLPAITTSTVILFIKIGLKPKQNKRGRLLVTILITLLCFLILTLPLYIILFIANFLDISYFSEFPELDNCFSVFACLNCSVNPVIYFLAGRRKGAQSKESLKVIFQRVFKEDGTPGEL